MHFKEITQETSYRSANAQLKEKKRGVKPEDRRLLDPVQEKQIWEMILDTMPDQLKLPYGLWTRKAVKELIERELGIAMAINTTGDYLRKWGFTPQKPWIFR